MLCAGWLFPTPDQKAHFSVVKVPESQQLPEGSFRLTTRRGRQFNSMVQGDRDDHTGANRDSVFISPTDAERLGIMSGSEVVVRNQFGELRGHALVAPVKERTLQVHWPEGQVLIERTRRSPTAGIPDYNAVVRLEPVVPETVVT